MAEEKLEKGCAICRKNDSCTRVGHSLCLACARSEMERLRKEFYAMLSPEQRITYDAYIVARTHYIDITDDI